MTIDRSEVFKDAHKRFKYARSREWHDVTFAQCLSTAWAAARLKRDAVLAFKSAPVRKRVDRPFPKQFAAEVRA
jgi:hypothetical protein